jgi:hypothetical protein
MEKEMKARERMFNDQGVKEIHDLSKGGQPQDTKLTYGNTKEQDFDSKWNDYNQKVGFEDHT